jgi:hypothetical protein
MTPTERIKSTHIPIAKLIRDLEENKIDLTLTAAQLCESRPELQLYARDIMTNFQRYWNRKKKAYGKLVKSYIFLPPYFAPAHQHLPLPHSGKEHIHWTTSCCA